jgi:hypothetical protein
MGRIDWIPIAEMPAELKDGRDLLGAEGPRLCVMAYLDGSGGDDPGWYAVREYPVEPTHFAEINPPEGE